MNATTGPLLNTLHGVEAYSVAQREFDAVNGEIRRRVNAAQERADAKHEAKRAEFVRMFTAPTRTTEEQARVNKVIEDNLSGDVMHALLLAAYRGHETHAFALAANIREDLATYFADTAED